jgi:hypothetical protein
MPPLPFGEGFSEEATLHCSAEPSALAAGYYTILSSERDMDRRHVHIDEISVWSWVAASVFAIIAFAAMILATQDKMQLASGLNAPALPFAEPALMPRGLGTDARV